MRVAIGADHAGFEQKQKLASALLDKGYEVLDVGPADESRVDYPDYASRVARAVGEGDAERGVLICGTGLGMAMAADKFPGVRAVAVQTPEFARLSRAHNDANVICLSGRFVDPEVNEELCEIFLATPFEGGRHELRVAKSMALCSAATSARTERFQVVDHPLVAHKLSILRDVSTPTKLFRELVRELALFVGYEATRDFPLEKVEITTPLETCAAERVAGKKVAVVPILRAGLGMVEGLLTLVPSAKVGHIGMYRDPKTHLPCEYYAKLPADVSDRTCLLVDPMLATGGSATMAIDYLRKSGVEDVRLLCLVAAPEGVDAVLSSDDQVRIFSCALDRELDAHAYILPGLGDAGDRIFGTL